MVSDTSLFAGTRGWSVWRRPVSQVVTSVISVSSKLPKGFSLSQNHPNPFNPTTTIRFSIKRRSHVRITVFDVLGRTVATLVDEALGAGDYRTAFDGTNFASGVYFYELETDEYTESRKMLLLK